MRTLLLSLCVFFFVSGLVVAQIPLFLNYQGQLLQRIEFSEDWWEIWPIREQAVDMAFRLYTSATGGGAVWYENHTGVVTSYEGIYSVQLGSRTPITLSERRLYWLGITVDENDEMSPRLPIGNTLSALFVQGLTLAQDRYLDLTPHSAAPELCTSTNAGAVALTSNYAVCICNGTSWRFVGYGTTCQW